MDEAYYQHSFYNDSCREGGQERLSGDSTSLEDEEY